MTEDQISDYTADLELYAAQLRAAARRRRVEQLTAAFSDPADRRDVKFILELQLEVEDLLQQVHPFLDDEGRVVRLQEADLPRLEDFISFCHRHSCVQAEKITNQIESYQTARSFMNLLSKFVTSF